MKDQPFPKASKMRILLINQNPIVSKLAGLSAQKAGFDIVEEPAVDTVEEGEYDALFIDDGQLQDLNLEELKERTGAKITSLIYADDQAKKEGFDYYIHKPFLPTEMVDLMSEIRDDLSMPVMEESEANESHVEEETVGQEEVPKEQETKEEVEEVEDFEALLSSLEESSEDIELGAESHEEAEKEEDFDELLNALEMEEEVQPAQSVQSEASGSQELALETTEESEEEQDSEEVAEDLDIDALLEEVETEEVETEDAPEALAEEISETLVEEEENEPLTLVQSEGKGGILDEELVSEVKELLEEETPDIPSESNEFIEEEIPTTEEVNEEYKSVGEEEGEAQTVPMPQEEVTEEPSSASEETGESPAIEDVEEQEEEAKELVESKDVEEELDLLAEEELMAVLGEETESPLEKKGIPEERETELQEGRTLQRLEGEALLAGLLGGDPQKLRELLAGAQVTINITFPKDL